MDRLRWIFHPIFVVSFSLTCLCTTFFLYIYWYMEASAWLNAVLHKFKIDSAMLESQTLMVVVVLSILEGVILLGISSIFIYYQKTMRLYRLQHDFIHNFTHELKTPVTSLRLYLQTFQKLELPRVDQQKYLKFMMQDADRLADNIKRILNLARLETGKHHSEFEICDIVKVIEEYYEQSKSMFGKSRVTIHKPAEHSYFFWLDCSMFDMLLSNIITNAFIYNRAPLPCVDIFFKAKKKHLHIFFQDNGIGIERAELHLIFSKFYQGLRASKLSAKGSGLGLYLVQSIARLHQGKITVNSKGIDQGSVFILQLPYHNTKIKGQHA